MPPELPSLFQYVVVLIRYRLQPRHRTLFGVDQNKDVYKPAIPGGTVPVLRICRYLDNISCVKLPCRLSPFLVVASAASHK